MLHELSQEQSAFESIENSDTSGTARTQANRDVLISQNQIVFILDRCLSRICGLLEIFFTSNVCIDSTIQEPSI